MCIIIIKKRGLKVSSEILKASARINPHGLGVVWLDDYSVSYHKSTQYSLLDTTRPFIAHFRYATIGAVNKSNTHPFVCGSNKNELLMMNGTIRGLGSKDKCDSKELAELLGDMPRYTWRKELEQYDCRFVTMNIFNKSFQIYNKAEWIKKDGIWYSKENVLETNLVAVYGTLKKGYSNYWSYLNGKSHHIGGGRTVDKYPLVISGLPYLINEKGNGHNVVVDVFKVSDSVMANLDRLEGHPIWYRREQINILLKGKKVLCWVYFNIKETSEGKVFHDSFKQRPYTNLSKNSFRLEDFTIFNQHEDVEDVEDFDIENEIPTCVSCYNDLEHDGFNLFHCNQCNAWYKEEEVLKTY